MSEPKTGKRGVIAFHKDRDQALAGAARALGSTVQRMVIDGRKYCILSIGISPLADEVTDTPDEWRIKATMMACLLHLDDAQVGEHVRNEAIEAVKHTGRIESREDPEPDPDTQKRYSYDYLILPDGREFRDCMIMWERVK